MSQKTLVYVFVTKGGLLEVYRLGSKRNWRSQLSKSTPGTLQSRGLEQSSVLYRASMFTSAAYVLYLEDLATDGCSIEPYDIRNPQNATVPFNSCCIEFHDKGSIAIVTFVADVEELAAAGFSCKPSRRKPISDKAKDNVYFLSSPSDGYDDDDDDDDHGDY